MAEADYMRA